MSITTVSNTSSYYTNSYRQPAYKKEIRLKKEKEIKKVTTISNHIIDSYA